MLNPRTRSAGKEEDVAEGHAGGLVCQRKMVGQGELETGDPLR